MKGERIRRHVKERYTRIAERGVSCCGNSSGCCGGTDSAREIARKVGYTAEELSAVPDGANLGLGCGNPLALASLREGETVLDLGSGPGFDCILAARRVGKKGRVIGVDMTPEMVSRARENARKAGIDNVEFRLGEIEHLPVADGSIDVIISNCVINLSTDKHQVFREAYRVLKPGGRLHVSDIVLLKDLPEALRRSLDAYASCIAGAMLKEDYVNAVKEAGFADVEIVKETEFGLDCLLSEPSLLDLPEELSMSKEEIKAVSRSILSIQLSARKNIRGE